MGKNIGRYEGVPERVYHGSEDWDWCNVSRLIDLRRSPAYCDLRRHEAHTTTPAKIFGSAVHCLLIRPDDFDAEYAQDPPCPAESNPKGWHNTKVYKAQAAELRETGVELLTPEQWEGCWQIYKSLHNTPSAALDLLKHKTGGEVSYVIDDPTTGVRCKIRTDIEVEGAGIICDIKTTRDCAPNAFQKSIYNYSYHMREAFYRDRLETFAPGKWQHIIVLAIENTAPYEFKVYEIGRAAVDLGRRYVDRLLAQYAECEERGEWPGYDARKVETVGVPQWAFNEEEEEEERRNV